MSFQSVSDINSAHVAVGYGFHVREQTYHALLWPANDTAATDLGIPYGDFAFAAAISEAGAVVGYSGFSAANSYRGFLWKNGSFALFDAPAPWFSLRPADVNSNDEVVGIVESSVDSHAFRYTSGGTFIDLHPVGAYRFSGANAISERGVVAGWVELPNRERHVARWSPTNVFTDLGMPAGSSSSEARGINASGTIVGFSRSLATGTWHPLVWRAATGFVVSPAAGLASDISDRGRIAGAVDLGGGFVAATKKGGGAPVSLPLPPGQASTSAFAVSRCGDVVGYSTSASNPGVTSAIRWRVPVCD